MKTVSACLALCAWNLPGTGEFPSQRPVTRSSDVFFDLRLNKRFSKQQRRWLWQISFINFNYISLIRIVHVTDNCTRVKKWWLFVGGIFTATNPKQCIGILQHGTFIWHYACRYFWWVCGTNVKIYWPIDFLMIASSITSHCHCANSQSLAQDKLLASRVMISCSHSSDRYTWG